MSRHNFSANGVCLVEGCVRPAIGKGWCRLHYNRWYRHGDPLGGGRPKNTTAWLLENAAHKGDDCLKWPFHTSKKGVAACHFRGQQMNAARAMCILAHGEPPSPAHDAAHSCGKAHEACVNPEHLRWATKVQNQGYRRRHGTVLVGIKNPAAKLTDDQVAQIISLRGKTTQREVAMRFGVCRQYVGSLWSGIGRAQP